MKILVDENIPFAEETFGQHAELERFHGRQLTPRMLAGAEALITRSITRVDASLLSMHSPKFIGSCTIGTDHLDINYLEKSDICWTAAPGCNAQSVVDYVLSALAVVNAGKLPETVGIVGCGNVGSLLRERLLKIGCNLKVYDPFLSRDRIGELTDSLDEVMSSGLVCLHTPLTRSGQTEFPTEGMIDSVVLANLPQGAILLNAGRGGVICETDLVGFMSKRPDVQVILDVWANEPKISQELMSMVKLATPHIAGYSMEGKVRGNLQVYRKFCDYFGFAPGSVELLPQVARKLKAGSIAELLLQIYNPQVDMYRMKSALTLASAEATKTSSWFDELRKNYPERREIASYAIEGEISSELGNFGFVDRRS